jgi:hypothetical protein
VRSLLRWTSLVASAAILYAVGVRRLHLHDFNAFLTVLLALALAVTAAFVLTRGHRAD